MHFIRHNCGGHRVQRNAMCFLLKFPPVYKPLIYKFFVERLNFYAKTKIMAEISIEVILVLSRSTIKSPE